MLDTVPSPTGFLHNDGECAKLIAAMDWTNSLGDPAGWPSSLKIATALLLHSPVPMVMLWGVDGIMIYNDAYSVFAGGRHPRLLGSKVREGWPEVADFNDHVMKVGLASGTLSYRDQELTLYRHDRPEQVWMNLDYSPVLDEGGRPGGVLAVVVETTGSVLAEEQLRRSEARLRAVLDGMNEGLLVLDREFRIVDLNAEGERMDRRSRAELIGGLHDEVYPDAAPEVMALYKRVLATGEPASVEHRYNWPTGGSSWLGLRAFPVEEGVAAFYRDITASKEAQERLRESEQRLRLVVDGASDYAIFTIDGERRITDWSQGAANIFKLSREEAIGRTSDDLWTPEDRAAGKPQEEVDTARREGCAPDERWHQRPDGTRVFLNGSVHPLPPDDQGQERGFIKIARDETDRRQTELALRETEERYRLAAQATNDAIWDWDLSTGHVVWNEAVHTLFGHQDAVGGTTAEWWIEHIHPDDRARVDRGIHAVIDEEGKSWQCEYRFLRADGSEAHVFDRGTVIRDRDGRATRMIGAMLDLTERHRAEAALAESEATLRIVLEQMPVGVILARVPGGEIVFYNQAAELILGDRILPPSAGDYSVYGGLHEDGSPLAASEYPLAHTVTTGESRVDVPMRYRRPDGDIVYLEISSSLLRTSESESRLAICVFDDVTQRKRGEQHQRLLIDELSHRAKNLLAIIQSVAQQSFKGERSPGEMMAAFEGRLGALAAAHGILTRQKWESAPLRQIVHDTVTAVKPDERRLHLDGPDMMVSPKTGVSLAMAVHELATNALKYGSFSNEAGTVDVRWAATDGRLNLQWEERGGPPVQPPPRRGFGSRMIERGLAAELGGTVRIDFQPAGIVCTVDAPLPDAA